MKPFRCITLLIAATLAVATLGAGEPPAPAKPPAPPLSPRFKQVRERIDALFQNRNETPAPPDARMNPFRPPGLPVEAPDSTVVAGGVALPESLVPRVPPTDIARLQEGVATLKVSGTFEKDGRLYLVINAKPYKDNDVIQTQVQGEPVYMRVRQISARSVTVVLNEAEMTLKF
jgi:hypothetical protein